MIMQTQIIAGETIKPYFFLNIYLLDFKSRESMCEFLLVLCAHSSKENGNISDKYQFLYGYRSVLCTIVSIFKYLNEYVWYA